MNSHPTIPAGLSDLPDLLRTKWFGRTARWLASVGSTNEQALAWASEGAPEGALVWADHQTAGRGRHRRAWTDSPGHNLLFSLILRPTLSQDKLGLIPLAAGLAVAETIEKHASLQPTLKWPNDVLINSRKVCGILLEGQLTRRNGAAATLVLGIGLNVNQIEFHAEVEERATSLALEKGRLIARLPLLADLLAALEERYVGLLEENTAHLLSAFQDRMVGMGEEASVAFPPSPKTARGIIVGLASSGALRLATSDGEKHFHAGEVTLPHGEDMNDPLSESTA